MLGISALLLLAGSLAGSVLATPLPTPHDKLLAQLESDIQHVKRQNGFYAINGVPGNTVARQEVRQLQGNADLWNLYLLGLNAMMKVDQSNKLSYYQISGIHGRPYLAWDGSTEGPGGTGYCTHASPLFGSWHRPYVALFEQVLYGYVNNIASQFPAGATRNRYVAAAANFRAPYWDWAAQPPSGQSILPPSVGSSSTVTVQSPTGQQTIHNPLYSYQFHPLNPQQLPNRPFSFWQETKRYPTSTTNPNASSRNNLVGQQLDNNRLTLRDRLYNLFTNVNDYNQVSNKAWYPNDGGSYDSVESIHDVIHGLVGSGGHMGVVDYSGFDPIFWLHHCMVDRVFALWQALYPNSYLNPTVNPYGTWSIPAGTVVNDQYPLAPFHKNVNGNYWNSADVRGLNEFGYTYPELSSSNLQATINNLYGQTAPANNVQKAALTRRDSPAPKPNVNYTLSASDTYTEYLANIKVDKLAAGGTFFIHIFLGPYNAADPFSWSFEPNLIGTQCIFVNADPSGTPSDQNRPVAGTIPLTGAIMDKITAGQVKSLNEADALPYLTKNLAWALSDTMDSRIPTENIGSLGIGVVSSKVKKPANSGSFPVWGPYTKHPEVTQGKSGGGIAQ